MKKRIGLTMFICFLCFTSMAQEADFVQPPQDARPQVWWHWIDGNISRKGIKADLEWMSRSGIGGFHQFDAGGAMMQMVQPVQEKVPYMQQEWKDDFRYALQLADSLGMEVTIASAPGWSSTGGPWVRPEQSMKKLNWRKMEVTGSGKKIRKIQLPEPYKTIGRYQNQDAGEYNAVFQALPHWYQDIAVVAVRLPEAEKSLEELGATVSSSGGEFTVSLLSNGDLNDGAELPKNPSGTHSWIQYSFPAPVTVSALTLAGGEVRDDFAQQASFQNYLLSSTDGEHWENVCHIPSCGVSEQTISIPTTTAKYFRLMIVNPVADTSYAAFGVPVVEPTGTRIHEWVLHTVGKIHRAQEKAGFSAPNDLLGQDTPAGKNAIQTVVDLTPQVKDGVLTWKVPEGKWRIYRFGASLIGKMNHPAPNEATGLEVDKLDAQAWADYFHTYLNMYNDAGGRPADYLLTDSYEAGTMTWTPLLPQEFKKDKGYDLIPWLPVLTGEIVCSAEESERFLFDWRQMLGELFARNYDALNELCKAHGLKGRYTESHEGGRLYVGDGMDLKRTAAIPMSAIWTGATGMAEADIRESASTAHLYGQKLVAAESFTANGLGGAYVYYPGNLKATADLALSCGLNRFVIHESPHQPQDNLRPGLGLMIFGQWFSRHETWAEQAHYWTDYLARSSYMLQRGQAVADILWYYGEDTNITGLYGQELPQVPEGFAYDFASPHALLNQVSAEEGKLVTASGMSYSILVLEKKNRVMSVEVLRKIAALVQEGVQLCGLEPLRPASLKDSPEEFCKLVDDIWHSGRSNVYTGSLQARLKQLTLQPDFQYTASSELRYVHRKDGKRNIYWVANFSDKPVEALVSFRESSGVAQVWNPETGKLLAHTLKENTLKLEARQAVFIVFDPAFTEIVSPEWQKAGEINLDGPWTLTFEGLEAPEGERQWETLCSLTEKEESRVKYFSGTTIYRNTFTLGKKEVPQTVSIDLGAVGEMAEVLVNGESMGFLWKAPYKIEGNVKLHPGKNTLEIKVINLWPNRLIGDAQPGATKNSYTVIPFYGPTSELRPAGLMGPVKLSRMEISGGSRK